MRLRSSVASTILIFAFVVTVVTIGGKVSIGRPSPGPRVVAATSATSATTAASSAEIDWP